MKYQFSQRAIYAAAGMALVGLMSRAARATIAIDGLVDTDYGSPLAVQTNNTGFGDNSTDTSGLSSGGSELDAAYGLIQNGNLNLFLAGNLETNNNHLDIFISDGRAGQSTLKVAAQNGLSNEMGNMTGSNFSSGFAATFALDFNGSNNGDGTGTEYLNTYDLTQTTATSAYRGSLLIGNGTSNSLNYQNGLPAAILASFNNGNVGGVGGGNGAAATGTPAAVSTGLEIAIPLADLGGQTGPISVLAMINGNPDNYLSNQFLPGLPTAEANLGNGGKFDFSSTPGQYFTVAAATGSTNINATWNVAGSGSWSLASNWTGGIPTNPGDRATFNTFNSGNTALSATVSLNGNHSVGVLTFNSSNSFTINQGTSPAGGILTINDTGDIAGTNPLISVAMGSHFISAPISLFSDVTVSAINPASLTISGNISNVSVAAGGSGTGNLFKTGDGKLILSASNSYSGSTTVNGGSLELDNAAAASTGLVYLGDASTDGEPATLNIGTSGLNISNSIVTNHDGSGLDNQRIIAATYNTGNATVSGSLYLDGGLVLSAPSGASLTVTGVIGNGQDSSNITSKDLTANGGTIVLTNAETYSGVTYVNAGTLTLATTASLASPSIVVNGGTFNLPAQNSGGIFTRTLAGTLTINTGLVSVAAATLSANRQLLVASGLTFAGTTGAWTGQLDLANNDLDIANGNLANITDQIRQGFNAGGMLWTGQGIISSKAAANTSQLTALGVIANTTDGTTPLYGSGTTAGLFDGANPAATDVLVKYTYYGDANLDGKVDGSDYSKIDNGFVMNLTGWANGDFNYDGVVNGSDYTLIDNAFNRQGAQISAEFATSTAQIAGSSAVPEPTTLALTTIAVAGLLGRRKRPN